LASVSFQVLAKSPRILIMQEPVDQGNHTTSPSIILTKDWIYKDNSNDKDKEKKGLDKDKDEDKN